MENKKTKRFYKVEEQVWVVSKKQVGRIESINKDTLEVVVAVGEDKLVLKMWEIDKLKYKAKAEVKKKSKPKGKKKPTVYFAKVREGAIIPTKRDEDAGYDFYALLEARDVEGKEVHEIECPAFKTTLVPTGIATALPKTHYLNLKHERGSTGKISMSVLAGVVDSGYRGEIFIAITPLHKDVVITSEVTDTEVGENVILYPYSKAIAQATIDLVPQVNIEVIGFDELQKIESERGTSKLGESGK